MQTVFQRLERYNFHDLLAWSKSVVKAWGAVGALALLCLSGCDKHAPKKPDAAKGVVTGMVLCADTGKPARFATVILTATPQKDEKLENGNPLPENESAQTDLEGRFRMEAVEPGHYYAYATLEGYLEPARGLDFESLAGLGSEREQVQAAIKQWKEHLVEVKVARGQSNEISVTIERAAGIGGTVSFDDGSPAIGLHFLLLRKTEKGTGGVGLALFDNWAIKTVSDGHGRYNLTNLSSGEYIVCALLGGDAQDAAGKVCLGNVFRRKEAKTVKVKAGEAVDDADITIPLSGLHTVGGFATALADGKPVSKGTIKLLWADDREPARASVLDKDGNFQFLFVPTGKYIVQVTEAAEEEGNPPGNASETGGASAAAPIHYADKEVPITVLDNLADVQVQLSPVGQTKKP